MPAGKKIKKTKTEGYPMTAVRDVPDLRDWPYEPSLRQLKRHLKPPAGLGMLDQKTEGACTGFALAAIINLLNRQRGNKTSVSARMLYEMAKRHDEWPGETYSGSSCRGAIKGWYNMGVCRDSKWAYVPGKPGFLTVDRARDARANTIGAYYRIQPRISDFHAALNETGAIYCSAHTHKGWNRPNGSTGTIPFEKQQQGGHAFAIVGYNSKGFWIQNSWTRRWGKGGLGLWQYEDWLENLMDAWVLSLALPTPQIWHVPVDTSRNRSGSSLETSPPRSEIAGHFIHVDDGRFHTQGRYWSNADDVRTTARNLADSRDYQHLLLYAHGGLNSPKDSAKRIATMLDTFKKNGIYPYHFMYDTGLMEELKDVVLRRQEHAEARAGGIADWTDRLIEWAARVPGRALWREMKSGARLPFLPHNAGAQTLKIFLDQLAKPRAAGLKIHLAGHSTGGILLAWLLEAMQELAPALRIASCNLLAPACRVDLFLSHYLPHLVADTNAFGIDGMRIFNLNDKLERNDQVAGVYRKSLLYLVSESFEEELPEAILGMKKSAAELQQQGDIRGLDEKLKIYYSDGLEDEATASTSHGGFDNDPATMNTLLETILGGAPEHPFTRDSLDY